MLLDQISLLGGIQFIYFQSFFFLPTGSLNKVVNPKGVPFIRPGPDPLCQRRPARVPVRPAVPPAPGLGPAPGLPLVEGQGLPLHRPPAAHALRGGGADAGRAEAGQAQDHRRGSRAREGISRKNFKNWGTDFKCLNFILKGFRGRPRLEIHLRLGRAQRVQTGSWKIDRLPNQTLCAKTFPFNQRVYGITTATVKVGYEYEVKSCGPPGRTKTVWDVQTARLAGHGMGDTDLGGWELSAHHRYNFHAGILQKGDGNTVYLKYKPQVRDEFPTFERGENAVFKFKFHCIF